MVLAAAAGVVGRGTGLRGRVHGRDLRDGVDVADGVEAHVHVDHVEAGGGAGEEVGGAVVAVGVVEEVLLGEELAVRADGLVDLREE